MTASLGTCAAALAGATVGTGASALVIAIVGGLALVVAAAASPTRCALLAVAGLPWMFYPASVGTFSISLAIPVIAVVGLALLASEPGGSPQRAPGLPRVAFGTLVIAAVVAAGLSDNLPVAFSRVLYLALFGLFGTALFRAVRSGRISRVDLARAVVFGAALAAIAVSVQFLYGLSAGRGAVTDWLNSVYPAFGGERAAGLSSRNWYVEDVGAVRGIFPFMAAPSAGQYLMLGLVAAVWLRRSRIGRTGVGATLETVALALIGAGLLMTFSRQAWIGALAGLLALAAHRRGLGALAVVGAVLALMSVLPLPSGSGTLSDYLISASDTSTTSSSTRIGLLEQAVKLVPDHALVGVGPGLFGTLNPDPKNPIYYAHNVVLDVAVEIGLLGAIAFLGVVLMAIRSAWRTGANLAFGMLIAFLVASMFDDVLYFPRNGILLAVAFALLARGQPPAAISISADASSSNGRSSASMRAAAAWAATAKG